MKLRSSLRLYVVGAMFVAGSLAILAMSGVAINYFFAGMDVGMKEHMHSYAFYQKVSDDHPLYKRDLTVASRWQDLPPIIQQRFDEQDLTNDVLMKSIDGFPLFGHPKAGYFVMRLQEQGETRYISIEHSRRFAGSNNPRFGYILLFGLLAIVLLGVTLILLIRKVSNPVRGLKNWASVLDKHNLNEPIPDFRYAELNTLAQIIQSSLSSVQEGLEREQRFLGYASHELRTPIAVIRSNTELLRKMQQKGVSVAKQQQVLQRVERATYTMGDLTETLLWLNRPQQKSLPVESLRLGELVSQLDYELRYLLDGKGVVATVTTDDTELVASAALCRIVITNLIRNAFQHTYNGKVIITQTGCRLLIVNESSHDPIGQQDLGFGLGLELTERLVTHCGWAYSNQVVGNGRAVKLDFS
ncbi:sensor histidine kinase [Vibrio gallicus]|uniref:sensor histidine kinase n=1 Tax=Vibrio gallicus TaxID=190897 RepID=UPI0021C42FD7|nr:HAMP domain-containing sensor histidine kinase [Vibrio gallicus]